MNTKNALAALLLMISTSLMADNYLTITYSGTNQNIFLPTVKRITFQDDNVTVITSYGEHSYPISAVEKISFTDMPDAIKTLPEQEENLAYKNGTLSVKGDGFLRVFSTNGILISIANIEEGANISLDNLPAGVYIVSMNGKTIKVKK